MKKTLFLFILLLTFSCFCQKNNPQNPSKDNQTPNISISFPKEIQVKTVGSKSENSLDKNMPWIVALAIGLVSAGINYLVGNNLRKSNEKNLQRQIESSNTIALTQFKMTIAAKNRQDWINELRHELSDLLSAFTNSTSEDATREEVVKYMDKILYSKAKIQLMINSQKPEQKDLQEKIEFFFNTYIEKKGELEHMEFAKLRQDVIISARKLFDLHWKKIKNLQ